MIIKTGLEVKVHRPYHYLNRPAHLQGFVADAGPVKVELPETTAIWKIEILDETGTVKHVFVLSTEPSAKQGEVSLLLSKDTKWAESIWEQAMIDNDVPSDAQVTHLSDEWSDTERRVARWWEVTL